MQLRRVELIEDNRLSIADAVPLKTRPTDIRAQHCLTARDLDLFKFSSDYQQYKGGHKDLESDIGLHVGLQDSCDTISLD